MKESAFRTLRYIRLYFEVGVQSYWLVLPDLRTVYVFSAPDEYEVYSKKVTLLDEQIGVELPVEEIFR